MNHDKVRNRYVSDGVTGASPMQVVTMLYERMLRDLAEADSAIDQSDWDSVNNALCHAQDIVIELRACLDVSAWSGGPSLKALYDYLIEQMIAANVQKSHRLIKNCRDVIEPLWDAWKQVATQYGDIGTTPETSEPTAAAQ